MAGHVGLRWYHPEVARLPKLKTVSFPDELRMAPGFEYREALWRTQRRNGDWACRNRFNGHFQEKLCRSTAAAGSAILTATPSTTALPPSEFGRNHPEYYSYRHGQGRITQLGQLCLSNPEVIDRMIDFVLKKMSNPEVRIVGVSANDGVSYCQCHECEAEDRKAGSHAGSLIEFVNKIAEVTAKHHPGKHLSTLAYFHTRPCPSEMRVHDNVIVRVCHMKPSCDSHPLAECELNRSFVRDLEGGLASRGRCMSGIT